MLIKPYPSLRTAFLLATSLRRVTFWGGLLHRLDPLEIELVVELDGLTSIKLWLYGNV